jgi:hypothetical protein
VFFTTHFQSLLKREKSNESLPYLERPQKLCVCVDGHLVKNRLPKNFFPPKNFRKKMFLAEIFGGKVFKKKSKILK